MIRLKMIGVALVAFFALGITATSAFAEGTQTLPDVHVLEGEKYPLHLNYHHVQIDIILDTAGNSITIKGLALLAIFTELSALGTFEALFLNVDNKKTKCNTPGDPEGEVLVKGAFHISTLTLSPLTVGILFLLNEWEIICGKVKIKLKGSVISSLLPSKEKVDAKELCGALQGNKKGKNNITKYENDNGEQVAAILEDNFGSGFLQTAEEVEGEVCPTVLESKMFTVLNL